MKRINSDDIPSQEGQATVKSPRMDDLESQCSCTTDSQISPTVKKGPAVLELTRGCVYEQLMAAYVQEDVPDKVVFEGGYSILCDALDEFWNTVLNKKSIFSGNKIKVLTADCRNEENVIRAIARILKMGWRKAHYFPKNISTSFLERCIFNRQYYEIGNPSAGLLLDYVDANDAECLAAVLQDPESQPETKVVDILKKYCSVEVDKCKNWKDNFQSVVKRITITNTCEAFQIWSKELSGIMEYEEFKFLTTKNFDRVIVVSERMNGERPPHTLWHTFFYGWDQDLVNFYADRISDVKLSDEYCCAIEHDTKHYLCSCKKSLSTMRRERHDLVMGIIAKQLQSAIDSKRGMFNSDAKWQLITMFANLFYAWPPELEFLLTEKKYPHIVAYTMEPKKEIVIIEPKISWEVDLDFSKECKKDDYKKPLAALEKHGFEVNFFPIIMGCRGVVRSDLYNLLEETFGLSQEKTSRTIEKISKKIIKVPYVFLPSTSDE